MQVGTYAFIRAQKWIPIPIPGGDSAVYHHMPNRYKRLIPVGPRGSWHLNNSPLLVYQQRSKFKYCFEDNNNENLYQAEPKNASSRPHHNACHIGWCSISRQPENESMLDTHCIFYEAQKINILIVLDSLLKTKRISSSTL